MMLLGNRDEEEKEKGKENNKNEKEVLLNISNFYKK